MTDSILVLDGLILCIFFSGFDLYCVGSMIHLRGFVSSPGKEAVGIKTKVICSVHLLPPAFCFEPLCLLVYVIHQHMMSLL